MQDQKDADLVVETSSGWVHGFFDRGVPNWRGVPYGEIPQRFRPPSPVASANHVEATRWGAISWQVPLVVRQAWSPIYPDAAESENCLNLNVWSPGTRLAKPRPVLVWLHPGAHVYGSGSQASTDAWVFAARHDAVVVTANYRLGPWGWLHLGALDPEFRDSANLTVLDQLLLLRWIRDNIAQFSGDPRNITIFGASSGASDVATLLGVPAARGLFHKAAVYSGNAEDPVAVAEALSRVKRFLVTAGSLASAPAELAMLSNVELRYVHRKMLRDGPVRYGPVIDGDIIPKPPLQSIGEGLMTDVPVLVSVTADEGRMYDVLPGHVVDDMYATLADAAPSAGHDEKIDAISQHFFIRPARRLLSAVDSAGGNGWAQVFDYHPTISPMARFPLVAGAPIHGADVAAIFIDPSGPAGNDVDRAVGAEEQRALIEFARTGQPGWESCASGRFPAKRIAPPASAGASLIELP